MGATSFANAVLQTAQQSQTITQEEEIKVRNLKKSNLPLTQSVMFRAPFVTLKGRPEIF